MPWRDAGGFVSIWVSELTKTLVTGANGWIGKAAVSSLRAGGYAVRTASRTVAVGESIVVNDFREQMAWGEALDGIDSVIHLAAVTRAAQANDADSSRMLRQVNVDATLQLARESAAHGVRRFVFMSSAKVNGERTESNRPFMADGEVHPEDSYSASKLEAERGLLQIARSSGMEVVIIRPPLVYGPQVKGNFAALVRAVLAGFPLPFKGLDNRRSMIALDNLVDLIVRCADREKTPRAVNEIFLVSDGDDVSLPELLRRIAVAYGKTARLFSVPEAWLRIAARMVGQTAAISRLADSLVVDVSKTESLLGWRPVVSMETQLEKMAKRDVEDI